jgi:hypothetical protein
MRLPKLSFLALPIAVTAFMLNGCGGSGGGTASAGNSGGTVNQGNVGGMTMTYQGGPLKTVLAGTAPVSLTGVSGGTITNLSFLPVPNMNQTSIVFNEAGEVSSYNLLTKTASPLTTLTPNTYSTSPSFSHDGHIVFYGVA